MNSHQTVYYERLQQDNVLFGQSAMFSSTWHWDTHYDASMQLEIKAPFSMLAHNHHSRLALNEAWSAYHLAQVSHGQDKLNKNITVAVKVLQNFCFFCFCFSHTEPALIADVLSRRTPVILIYLTQGNSLFRVHIPECFSLERICFVSSNWSTLHWCYHLEVHMSNSRKLKLSATSCTSSFGVISRCRVYWRDKHSEQSGYGDPCCTCVGALRKPLEKTTRS